MLTTTLFRVPLVPEMSLHLAGAEVGLFDATGGEFRSDEPPPFWAFVWAGGQALARHLLDYPELVRGRRVLDVAAGSGVAAIAAAMAGAASVSATDIDPAAAAAIRRNAAANGVTVAVEDGDGDGPDYDVVLAGDAFYAPTVAEQMTAILRKRADQGARILVGDPGRGYFPDRLFALAAEYTVPVPALLEETEALVTGVYEMRATLSGR